MLQSLRKRVERDEEGFTLIELMVVVLIIAILLAIAIPTFLGARERAQDRAAQSNLRNALTAEKVIYTDNQAYTTSNTVLEDVEPSLSYAAAAIPTTVGTVYVAVSTVATTGDQVTLGTKSASGKCFFLRDLATGANAGTYYGVEDPSGACTKDTVAANAAATKW